jgi:dolichol-phosphate mannosyltransferase
MTVPTYNEAPNIPELLGRLDDVRKQTEFDLLVVDDNSPDGTASAVRSMQPSRPWLHLLARTGPLGLGSAYRDGFRWGLDRGYDWLGEMDADLSHAPEALPALVKRAFDGADLVLGSRYVTGGMCPDWPVRRRALSRAANLFARTALRLPIGDVTSGFRIYSQRAARRVLDVGTDCDGYGFQVEAVHAVFRAGLQIAEVPIVFRDRTRGTSKMSLATALEAARRCVTLAVSPAARRVVRIPRSSTTPGSSLIPPTADGGA